MFRVLCFLNEGGRYFTLSLIINSYGFKFFLRVYLMGRAFELSRPTRPGV